MQDYSMFVSIYIKSLKSTSTARTTRTKALGGYLDNNVSRTGAQTDTGHLPLLITIVINKFLFIV